MRFSKQIERIYNMANGNGVITKTIVGATATLITGGMFMLGNGVIDNDRRNTDQHIQIRSELTEIERKSVQRQEEIKDIIYDVRTEQKVMLKTLEGINKKL